MYIPPHFQCTEQDVYELLNSIGAVDLITFGDGVLEATFMPMLYERDIGRHHGVLKGHLARANPHVKRMSDAESLVIVHGVDSYISPSYYPSKVQHHKVVPTWNYLVVHIYGDVIIHDDPIWLAKNVRELTNKYELSQSLPWSVDDAPPNYIEAMLKQIVGVEMIVNRIEAKSKMSQNRSLEDVTGVISGLIAAGNSAGADAVRHANDDSTRTV